MRFIKLLPIVVIIGTLVLAGCSDENSTTTTEIESNSEKSNVSITKPLPKSSSSLTANDVADEIKTVAAAVPEIAKNTMSESKPKSMVAEKTGESIFVICAACHGAAAEGNIGPKLSGQTEQYLIAALTDFKAGKSKGPLSSLMIPNAQNLSDNEIKIISKYISSL